MSTKLNIKDLCETTLLFHPADKDVIAVVWDDIFKVAIIHTLDKDFCLTIDELKEIIDGAESFSSSPRHLSR